MTYLFKSLIFIVCITSFTNCKERIEKNKSLETTKEWIQLFNGKNLNDWIVKIKGYPPNENVYNTFRVKDEILKVSYDGYETFNNAFGHIFYKNPFSNYKLRLQYRFIGDQVNGGEGWAKKNSGVMIHSQSPESMKINQDFPVSLEVQLLGGLDKNIERPTGNLCTPGMHITMSDEIITDHCIHSSSPTFYGEEWIDVEIEAYNDSLIIHKINGKEVISYSKPFFGGQYNTNFKEGEPVKDGYISLQSESHPIEFRNIELLELD